MQAAMQPNMYSNTNHMMNPPQQQGMYANQGYQGGQGGYQGGQGGMGYGGAPSNESMGMFKKIKKQRLV